METNSLTYKTLRNSSYFFVSYALPIAVAVFVTPFIVYRLGVAEYGVFVLVNTIMAFFGFVDLGLSTALVKFAAEYYARSDFGALQRLLNSAKSLSYVFGFIGLVLAIVIGKWLLPAFRVQIGSLDNMFVVFIFAGIAYFFNMLNLAPTTIVGALQRYDLIAKINMFTLVFSNVLYVVALALGYQLKVIMAINALSAASALVYYQIVAKRELPTLKVRTGWDKSEIKKAYGFGLKTFASNLASGALIYVDRLIIPAFLGPAQLAYYSLPGNVAIKASGVAGSLAPMLFPLASALEGAGEQKKLETIYVKAFRNLSIVSAGITLSVVLFAEKILFFWLGPEFAEKGAGILVILAITYYFVGLYIPLQSMLLGLGKLDFLIKISVIMALINLTLLLILIPKQGITGAAWAYLISVLPMVYAFWWVEHRYFDLRNRLRDYLKLYGKLMITGIVAAVIIGYALEPLAQTLWGLLIFGPVSVVLYFVLYYIFGFAETEDLTTFKNFFNRFILRKQT